MGKPEMCHVILPAPLCARCHRRAPVVAFVWELAHQHLCAVCMNPQETVAYSAALELLTRMGDD